MKFFRFLKNLFHACYDVSGFKDDVKMCGGIAAAITTLSVVCYALGGFAIWIGLDKYIPQDGVTSPIESPILYSTGVGAVISTVAFMLLVVVLVVLNTYSRIKKIWKNS